MVSPEVAAIVIVRALTAGDGDAWGSPLGVCLKAISACMNPACTVLPPFPGTLPQGERWHPSHPGGGGDAVRRLNARTFTSKGQGAAALIQQPDLPRLAHRILARKGTQLAKDILQVPLDGARRKIEGLGDALGGQPTGQMFNHFKLTG